MFTLWAPLPTVQTRECDRPGRASLGPAVEACHREIEANLGQLGTIIDATTASPLELAEALATRLGA